MKKKKVRAKGRRLKLDPISTFKRVLHSGTDIRNNLFLAKKAVRYKSYPNLVDMFIENGIYKGVIITNEFPNSLADYHYKKRLKWVDGESELVWTASILAHYSERLGEFSELRDQYEKSLLISSLNESEGILNDIEKRFGVTTWLISARFYLLQSKGGLAVQKDYLNSILSEKGLDPKTAILCWYFSYRNEESVNMETLKMELSDILEIPSLNDYFRMHITPYDVANIVDVYAPLAMEENNSLIDRYQALLFVVGLSLSREVGPASDATVLSLSLLKNIEDPRLKSLIANVERRIPVIDSMERFYKYDEYTEGNYHESSALDLDVIELSARSNLLSGEYEGFKPSNLAENISFLMSKVLCVSNDYVESRVKLKKIYLGISSTNYGVQLSTFLQRDFSWVNERHSDELSRLEYVSSSNLNPKHIKEMGEVMDVDPLDWIKCNAMTSPTFKLQYAINCDYKEGVDLIYEIKMPEYRRNLYLGHLAYRSRNYVVAIDKYKAACDFATPYLNIRAHRYLYNTYWVTEYYEGCLDLTVSQCLLNESLVSVYPVESLAGRLEYDGEYLDDLRCAIVLSFCSRFFSPKWDVLLSDVYENVLLHYGVNKPSELFDLKLDLKSEEITYFLRYIAIVRVMDDSIEFDTQEDVERERIRVCQYLINIDADNEVEYSNEIRSLIYNIEVLAMYELVKTSKIYVNEEGLKSTVDSVLKVFYSRFLSLLSSPEISYRAEDTTNKLKELMRKYHDSSMDDISVPGSEKKSLFANLLGYFLEEFAFNVAYGLDTNLSTTVRHGEFEGVVKKSFELKSLLVNDEGGQSDWFVEKYFSACLLDEKEEVRSQLIKFGKSVKELISLYLDKYIQVRTTESSDGCFNFYSTQDDRDELMRKFNSNVSYDDFFKLLLSYSWSLVDVSMDVLKSQLDTEFRMAVNKSVDRLLNVLKKYRNGVEDEGYLSTIVSAKEEFNAELDGAISWFERPADIEDKPCSLFLVVDVALKQTNNCYVKHEVYLSDKSLLDVKICGTAFKSMVGILYILLQNIVLHSNISSRRLPVKLEVSESSKFLEIKLTHKMYGDFDFKETESDFESAVKNYQRDNALKMARKEGGSGLSKIWRISHFELQSESQLNMRITQDGDVLIDLKFLKETILL